MPRRRQRFAKAGPAKKASTIPGKTARYDEGYNPGDSGYRAPGSKVKTLPSKSSRSVPKKAAGTRTNPGRDTFVPRSSATPKTGLASAGRTRPSGAGIRHTKGMTSPIGPGRDFTAPGGTRTSPVGPGRKVGQKRAGMTNLPGRRLGQVARDMTLPNASTLASKKKRGRKS